MTTDRAYRIIADISEGGDLAELGMVDAYDNGDAIEAAHVFFASGMAGTSPGRMGRAAADILGSEDYRWN